MRIYILILLLIAMALPQPALAQGPSSAIDDRELHRREEHQRQRQQEMEDEAPNIHYQVGAPEEALAHFPENESPCLVINEITLEGRDWEKFQWALAAAAEARGRCLGGEGINVLMARVQNRIVERGFVTTRIVAAPQDLTSGRLVLTVIPGRVGQIRLSDESPQHVYLPGAVPISQGDILNIRDVEQALENLKRVPTVEADIQITPGMEEGESDLVVVWSQGRPVRVSLSLDDSGSKFTGRYQAGATISVDNLFGFSDLFYFSANRNAEHGRPFGTEGYSFYYSIPWGYNQITFNASSYDYHQRVAGYLTSYEYSGASRSTSLAVSRVIHRSGLSKTSAGFSGFTNVSRNFVDGSEIEIQRRRMSGWEGSFDHRQYIGPVTVDASVVYHRGTGAFSALPAPEERLKEGTSRPEILKFDLRAVYPFQALGGQWRYNGHLRHQRALDRLISRDRISIGGRYTVRGYDGEMTLSADNGLVFRNEMALALGQTGQEIYTGLDFGRVWGPMDEYLLGRSLSGAALGLRGYLWGVSYDFFISRPLNHPDLFPVDSVVSGFNVSWQF